MLATSQIKIAGVGGAGIAVLNDLAPELPAGVATAAVDTDAAAVEGSAASVKIALIENGEGSGADTMAAKEAAVAHAKELETLADGARLLVILAGLGGGTGSVVAPMISKIAAQTPDCAVFAFSVLPLSVEGSQRQTLAFRAQNYLAKHCRAAFALPNDIILARLNAPIAEAFAAANANVVSAAASLVKMLSARGIVNVDFPTLSKVFPKREDARAFVAYGTGAGEDAVARAVAELSKSPMLPDGAKPESLVLSLRCGKNFEMNKMQMLLESVSDAFGRPERMAFGAAEEDAFSDNIEVCVMGPCSPASKPAAVAKEEQPAKAQPEAQTAAEPEAEQPASPAPAQSAAAEERASEDVSIPEAKDDTITSNEKVEVAAPLASAAANTPAPVPAEPEEKGRKSFFGFGRKKKKAPESPKTQTEFEFMELSQQRGFFQDTPPNIRNGVDLDVPTYMRKGIKIVL